MSDVEQLSISASEIEDARQHVPKGPEMTYDHLFTAVAISADHTTEEVAAALQVAEQKVRSFLRRKDVADAICALVRRDVQVNGVPLARKTLVEIAKDENNTGASRAKAANTILNWAGETNSNKQDDDTGGKRLEDMSIAELEELVTKLEREAKSKSAATVQAGHA